MLAPGHLTVLRTIDIRAVLGGARELRERLTARQREVLTLVARGATNAQIAERLSISEKTVGKHLEHVYETLGVVNRPLPRPGGWRRLRDSPYCRAVEEPLESDHR